MCGAVTGQDSQIAVHQGSILPACGPEIAGPPRIVSRGRLRWDSAGRKREKEDEGLRLPHPSLGIR